jgi:hypothetical protein
VNRSALFILLPLLAGCDVHSSNSTDENVTIQANADGQVAFNFPFAKGKLELPSSVMRNGQFDIDGVRMIQGGTMSGFHLDSANGVNNVNMTFTAPQSPDEVRAYFLDQFKQKGVEAAIAGDAVTGRSRDGDPFTIHVTPGARGSQGSIAIQSRD